MRGNSDESNCFTRAGVEALANRRRAGILLDAWRYKIARGLDGKGREETGNKKQEKRARGAGDIDIPERRAESRSMVNAMRSENQSRKLVNTSCSFLIDPCAGTILRPLSGSRFEFLCNIDGLANGDSDLPLVSVAEAARRCALRPKTLYHWIETGKLRREHGLRTIGARHRIEWPVFRRCIERGDLSPCS
jgi:hypothetical protein